MFPKCLPHRLLVLAERASHEFLMMVAFILPKKTLCVIIEAIINSHWQCWILVYKKPYKPMEHNVMWKRLWLSKKLGGEKGRDRKRRVQQRP